MFYFGPSPALRGMPIALVPAFLNLIGTSLLIGTYFPSGLIERSPIPQAILYPGLFLLALLAVLIAIFLPSFVLLRNRIKTGLSFARNFPPLLLRPAQEGRREAYLGLILGYLIVSGIVAALGHPIIGIGVFIISLLCCMVTAYTNR